MQLHCNVHPLDSTARDTKKALISLDKKHAINGNCYGSEGTAANLINVVSVMRFKDGTGDPMGFKNFLRQYNLPAGTFVRYVGNRLHVLYHLAGVLILHEAKLKEFIETQCTAGGHLRSSVSKDLLKNVKIMAQVWALGMAGKLFSGPWMTKFYSSHMSNLEMRPLVQQCVASLSSWIQTPHDLLQPTHNAFHEPFLPNTDEVLTALITYASDTEDLQLEALTTTLQACLCVLQRQLSDFLTDRD